MSRPRLGVDVVYIIRARAATRREWKDDEDGNFP